MTKKKEKDISVPMQRYVKTFGLEGIGKIRRRIFVIVATWSAFGGRMMGVCSRVCYLRRSTVNRGKCLIIIMLQKIHRNFSHDFRNISTRTPYFFFLHSFIFVP